MNSPHWFGNTLITYRDLLVLAGFGVGVLLIICAVIGAVIYVFAHTAFSK